MASAKRTRTVMVNINPGGLVHELTCNWLKGSLNSGGNSLSYKEMRVDEVPPSKLHCSRC